MEFTKETGFGERFTFPENVEITINGDAISSYRQAAVRMVEMWEDSVISEIVKEAKATGYTEVTVLNKQVIMDALRKYTAAPKTNADRIRAMSDEELADFLSAKFANQASIDAARKGSPLTATYLSELHHTWYVVWMQWLRQPAEEGY